MKAPTKQLTPEVRKKVAEVCESRPSFKWAVKGNDVIWVGAKQLEPYFNWRGTWNPKIDVYQKDAITHKLAQVIKSKKGLELTSEGILFYVLLERFNEALATDDTTALEALLAELMGFDNG